MNPASFDRPNNYGVYKMKSTFIDACKRQKTPYYPVWFMRQAGRFLPGYQKIRKRHSFIEMLKTPELITEVTMEPIHVLGVDAAIIFSDILTLPDLMGMKLDYVDGRGPFFESAVSTEADVKRLHDIEPSMLSFLTDAIRLIVSCDAVPLIVFVGSPLTTALYMMEGGHQRNFLGAFKRIFSDVDFYRRLAERLVRASIQYLSHQIDAGASAVQIFDSYGEMLTKEDAFTLSLPYIKDIVQAIKAAYPHIPVILFSKGTASYFDEIISFIGADVYNPDWVMDLARLERPARDYAIQGNLNPLTLFAGISDIQSRVRSIIDRIRQPGYIFNVGHGLNPEIDYVKLRDVVQFIHELPVHFEPL